MTLSSKQTAVMETRIEELKVSAVPFAMATVVRTVNSTSAKPGGKALISQDGEILEGWVGGGCAKSAVSKAAREAIKDGQPRFISLRPQELLESDGLQGGQERDGILFERNGCPSKGTMDIFIEPVRPMPRLVIFGTSLVADALKRLGQQFDFDVSHEDQTISHDDLSGVFIVIATQGKGDLAALKLTVSTEANYLGFVGSKRKFETLANKIMAETPEVEPILKTVHAPAGLAINAITPEEIALSVLAQIVKQRRGEILDREQAHE